MRVWCKIKCMVTRFFIHTDCTTESSKCERTENIAAGSTLEQLDITVLSRVSGIKDGCLQYACHHITGGIDIGSIMIMPTTGKCRRLLPIEQIGIQPTATPLLRDIRRNMWMTARHIRRWRLPAKIFRIRCVGR